MCVNAIDIKSGRVDRYCVEYGPTKSIYLLYDGMHYDPLFAEISSINLKYYNFKQNSEFTEKIENAFLTFADNLREKREFTDDQMAVICGDCNEIFETIVQASKHGADTGHSNFIQT